MTSGPLAQPIWHMQCLLVTHKVKVYTMFPFFSYPPSPTLYHSITTCLLVRDPLLISETWMSREKGKPYLFILASPLGPSSHSLKTSASSSESIRHKALWESLENISHWLICSPGSQRTRAKLYIVMAFIEPDSVPILQESIIYG